MKANPFPIFVINLKRSSERRIRMSQQLDTLGLEYHYIEAVDGAQFTAHEVVEKYGDQVFCTNTYNGQCMTLGSLGCLLSHVKIYDLMVKEEISAACILEDDAVLSPLFAKVLDSEVLQQVEWGTLLLGHYSMYRKSFNEGAEAVYWRKRVCRGHYIARAAEFPFTTLGYLLKLSTAKKLRDLAFPVRMPADWVTGNTELVGDTLRIITPPCAVSSKRYRKESTVRDGTDTLVPPELRRQVPTLSLRRHLTVGLANMVFGPKAQRAAAAFDKGKAPSTYSPAAWRTPTNDIAAEGGPDTPPLCDGGYLSKCRVYWLSKAACSIYKTVKNWAERQSHRSCTMLGIIKERWFKQRVLWHEMKGARSFGGVLAATVRVVFNMPAAFFSALSYLMQDINRVIYYGRTLSAIRIYIKKTGLFNYTRIV